jgi:hypothetical protein
MINKVTFLSETADKQFKKWQAENAEAFYLNIRGKKAMQHKADCWHLGDGEGMNSVSNSKVCSSISDELKEWAEDNKLEFEICSDCCK